MTKFLFSFFAVLLMIAYFAFSLPSITYLPPTSDDLFTTSSNWVFVNITSSEDLNQSLLEWANHSGSTNFSMLNSSPREWYYNLTNLSDGNYNYAIWAQNSTGYWNQSMAQFVMVDTTLPQISFVYPTPNDGDTTAKTWVYINATIYDFSNATALIDWNRSLVGWWRFNQETGENNTLFRDWSVHGNNGSCSGAACPNSTSGKFGSALWFDGVDDYIDAGNGAGLNITDAITIEAWVKKQDFYETEGVISKGPYSLKIDANGKPYLEIISGSGGVADVGLLQSGRLARSLGVYNGSLYGGTADSSRATPGHVYRYDGGTTWTDVGSMGDGAAYVFSLAVYDGKLYGGSDNGKAYSYDGTAWTDTGYVGGCGETVCNPDIFSFAVHGGNLYAGVHDMYGSAHVYRYDGGTTWADVGQVGAGNRYTLSLASYNGSLYVGTYRPSGSAHVYRYDGGTTWTDVGQVGGGSYASPLNVYDGKLYSGTFDTGQIYRYDGGTNWTYVGKPSSDTFPTVHALAVYNGRLHASAGSGRIFRYDGGTNWTEVGQFGSTEARSLTVYDGKLYGAGGSSGRVYSLGDGLAVYADAGIGNQFNLLSATYNGSTAKISINALERGNKTKAITLDTNNMGLLIGSSAGSSHMGSGEENFKGAIDEVRVYNRALDPGEINAFYNAGVYRNFTNLTDGRYEYTVYAEDLAGNWNNTETRQIYVNRSATHHRYNFTLSNRLGQIMENATLRIYNDSAEDAFAEFTLNASAPSEGFNLDRERKYRVRYSLQSGQSLSIMNLTISASATINPQFVDLYTGAMPSSTTPSSYAIALNSSGLVFDGAEIILPLTGAANRILHCSSWNYSGAACSFWESNETTRYSGSFNSTHFVFAVTSFDAYMAGYYASCSDGVQNGGETGIDCGGACNACANTVNTGGGSVIYGGVTPETIKTMAITPEAPFTKIVVNLRTAVSNPVLVAARLPAVPVSAPSGAVYQYLNVTKLNFDDSNIANATIEFNVSKDWIAANNIANVYLARYAGGWNNVRTEMIASSATYNSYRAYTNAFSYFAILGERVVLLPQKEATPPAANETSVPVPNRTIAPPAVMVVTQTDIDAALESLNAAAPQTADARKVLETAHLKIIEAQTAFNNNEQERTRQLLKEAGMLVAEAAGMKAAVVADKPGYFTLLLVLVAIVLAGFAYSSRHPLRESSGGEFAALRKQADMVLMAKEKADEEYRLGRITKAAYTSMISDYEKKLVDVNGRIEKAADEKIGRKG